jgi:hypothetical protein
MREFQIQGNWWLPDAPETEHGGVLSFTFQEGLSLYVFGTFSDDIEQRKVTHVDTIHGIAGAMFVSLCRCSVVRRPLQQPTDIASSRVFSVWSIGFALMGHEQHFSHDHRFSTVAFELGHLRDWLGTSGITTEIEHTEGIDEPYDVTARFRQPSPLKGETNDLQIEIRLNAGFSEPRSGSVRIEERCEARVSVKEPLDIETWLAKVVRPFTDLISFATAAFNDLTEFRVFDPGDQEAPRRRPGTRVVHSHSQQSLPPERALPKEALLFSAEQVADRFGDVMDRWPAIGNELDSVFGLFFGVQYSGQPYPEYRFYSMVQALESYHRRRRRNYALEKVKHLERLDSILKVVPTQHRKWLDEKLRYSNEPSLRGRMKDLTSEWEAFLLPIVGDRKSFVDKVVNTRNYYTHYDESLRQSAARGEELIRLTDILFVTMQACLLQELGFEHTQCIELIMTSADYWLLTDPVPGSFPPRVDASRIITLGDNVTGVRLE